MQLLPSALGHVLYRSAGNVDEYNELNQDMSFHFYNRDILVTPLAAYMKVNPLFILCSGVNIPS